MAKPEELHQRWKENCPTEAGRNDVEKVAKHYLGDWLTEGAGSHFLIVEHPALSYCSAFGGKDTLAISLKSGRNVKGIWVKRLMQAIDAIMEYETIMKEGK